MGNINNFLVPTHRKLNETEINSLLKKFNVKDTSKLPKIKLNDFVIKSLKDIVIGDVVEIIRKSFAGKTKYYRVVIE